MPGRQVASVTISRLEPIEPVRGSWLIKLCEGRMSASKAVNLWTERNHLRLTIGVSWCYTLAAVVTALGLCVGAYGLYIQSSVHLVWMVASIGMYGVLRLVAGLGEWFILARESASFWTPIVMTSWCYTLAAVVTALGLCVGAYGLFVESGALVVWMVVSIAVYGVLRFVAGVFEHVVLKREAGGGV